MASKIVEILIEDAFKSAGGFVAAKAGIDSTKTAAEESSKSIAGMDDTLGTTGSKMGATGMKVGAAVGVAVGGALAEGFASSVSFDASQKKLEASFATGSEEAKTAGDAAGKLYADGYTESMDEIDQAVKQVIQSGAGMQNATSEQVQEITGQFLSLAKVMNVDVGSSIESVATMVKTHMVPDMQGGIDLVTAAYQKLGPAADGVIGTVQKNAEEFQRLGISGQEAMGLIVQGMNAGAGSADAVGNSFKLFANTVLSGTKASEEGLQSLGLATDIYGSKSTAAGKQASASFSVSAADADNARQVLDKLGLSVDSVTDKTDKSGKTSTESFKVSGASVTDLQTKLDAAGISMTSFSDKVATGSTAASGGLKVIGINADDIRGKLAAGGDTANAAFADIVNRLKDIKDPLEQNTIGTELFGKSWKTVSESILAFNPQTAVQGLGQINGSGKALNATVEDTAQNKLTAMKNKFQEFMAGVVNAPGVLGTIGTAFAAFGVSGIGALSGIAQISQALPAGFASSAGKIITTMANMAGSFIATAAVSVASGIAAAGAWIAANIAMIAATGGIILAVAAVVAIAVLVIQHWQSVKDFFGMLAGFLGDVGRTMWDGIKQGAEDMVNGVIAVLNGMIGGINTLISGIDLVPGVSIPHIPNIPYASFAAGGISAGGLALVGEHGPELVNLPSGSRVYNNSESQAMAGSNGAGVHITIDSGGSTLDNLLVHLLRTSIRSQGGNVQTVLGTSS
jgi:phage-related minor tail protein